MVDIILYVKFCRLPPLIQVFATRYRERDPLEYFVRSFGGTFIYKPTRLTDQRTMRGSTISVVIRDHHAESDFEENYVWY
jgi:hypothetical protein